MNYGELKALAEFYIHRTDLSSLYDQFFDQARELISKEARLIAMETRDTWVLDANRRATLPADFIEFRSVVQAASKGQTALSAQDRNQFAEFRRAYSSPRVYTIDGGVIECGNASDIEVVYYERPAVLRNDSDTNAVLNAYPNLYLFAGLSYMHHAVQDIESQQNALAEFAKELDGANDTDEIARRSGSSPAMIAR